ncbi:S-adenosyl-L-methionine-dependent methyltransferase [Pilobolus umbonatus]|nr:S-adenosyl-L-methionine-dependent methyltransferase [Pilobolus umbonatus]
MTDTGVDWEGLWQNEQIMWDAGQSSPALVSLLQDKEADAFIPKSGYGLVPACGSGYDVFALATKDRHVTGLDVSKTCIDKVNKKHPNSPRNNYNFICADFFQFQSKEGGYDFAYDYTFLCALPPHLRTNWANRYHQIIKKGGILITLMFPLDAHKGGPPYALSVDL